MSKPLASLRIFKAIENAKAAVSKLEALLDSRARWTPEPPRQSRVAKLRSSQTIFQEIASDKEGAFVANLDGGTIRLPYQASQALLSCTRWFP